MKKDNLFNSPKDPVPAFCFDENVTQVFDDMLVRSVPLYRETVKRQVQLALDYYQSGSRIFDLGCSHGNFGMTLLDAASRPFPEMVGVDTSGPMLERYAERLKRSEYEKTVQLVHEPVEDIRISEASVVVLNLTLQFITPTQRDGLIRHIHEGLVPGGLLLITEKTVHDDAEIHDLYLRWYQQFKRENGYSELEISQKRDALENVLVPDTPEVHESRLRRAGFQSIDTWLKWFNFSAMLAVKAGES